MKTIARFSVALVMALAVVASTGGPASASPPSNDTEQGAVPVDAVPFTHSVDATDATADGPRFCSSQASVYYSFTPSADVRVQVDTLGSEYDTELGIYTRDEAGKVDQLGCSDDRVGRASGLRLRAAAGVTYVFMVGVCCGNPSGDDPGEPGGPLVLSVTEVDNTPLETEMEVDTATRDRATGIVTVSGTVTCTRRSGVYAEGTLR